MIDKHESPIEAVMPSDLHRKFLVQIVTAASEYAWSQQLTDMYFQGHSDQSYFGAYSAKIIRRGAGLFIFGFARRGGALHFAFPIDIAEPYRLAKSWIGDPTRNRAMIELVNDPDEEMRLYLIELAKRSIVHHYARFA